MAKLKTRRALIAAAATLIVLAGLVALASGSTSTVTRARLERNLPQTFARLYVQQAKLLGHRGITVASLHPRAQCDKGGPDKPDVGPGADWICLMSWQDPNVPLPDGSAKFELNVHSNDCYTAGGPSKYVGQLQIADLHGKQVDNPVFEFDSCFDPKGSNAPTGVDFDKPASASLTPLQAATQVAKLTLPAGTMSRDANGKVAPSLTCSPGKDGCAGDLAATIARHTVTTKYILPPDDTEPITLALPKALSGEVKLKVTPVIGTATRPTSTFRLAR